MSPVGFERTISAGERPQTYASDHAATGTGTDSVYNKCKSTFQFSNLAKYSHGPPEDGFKGDRNMQGRILSVLIWDFSILKCSEVRELEQ